MISVIIPIYNKANYLRKCLDSIKYQTYHNLEIICIDDGSTDNSYTVLKDYEEDKRFRLYKQENKGVGYTRNKGVQLAKGEWISFVDADDWLLLDLYDNLIEKSKKYNFDVYMFNVIPYVEHMNDITCRKRFFDKETWQNKELATIYDCLKPFSGNMSVYNRVYKKELIENIKFPENIKYEDILYCFKVYLRSKLIYIDETPYYRFRNFNTGSLSQEVSKKVFDIFTILDMLEEEIKYFNKYEHFKYALFQAKFNMFLNHFKMCPERFKEEYFNEMKTRLLIAEQQNLDHNIVTKLRGYDHFLTLKYNNYIKFKEVTNGDKRTTR